jgi:hypothetical protein
MNDEDNEYDATEEDVPLNQVNIIPFFPDPYGHIETIPDNLEG